VAYSRSVLLWIAEALLMKWLDFSCSAVMMPKCEFFVCSFIFFLLSKPEFCVYLRPHQVLPEGEINLFNLSLKTFLLNKFLFRLLLCHCDLSNARIQKERF